MTTKEIAKQLVAYCRKGDWEGAQTNLYAEDAKSTEPYATPEFQKETTGLKAIRDKSIKFDQIVEQTHGIDVSEPLIAGNTIAFALSMDVTMKGQGRMKIEELCVYGVNDGKIISEEFFM